MSETKLVSTAVENVFKKKFRILTPAILLSVMEQESELEPYFLKTDKMYKQNMRVAMATLVKTEAEVLHLVTLPGEKIAKFRMEPGTFHNKKYAKCPAFPHRFYISSSWGLGQCMGFNLIEGVPPSKYISRILEFAGDLQEQVDKCASDMENLLIRAKDSPSIVKKDIKSLVFYAYCGYNSGKLINKDQAVISRANEVAGRI